MTKNLKKFIHTCASDLNFLLTETFTRISQASINNNTTTFYSTYSVKVLTTTLLRNLSIICLILGFGMYCLSFGISFAIIKHYIVFMILAWIVAPKFITRIIETVEAIILAKNTNNADTEDEDGNEEPRPSAEDYKKNLDPNEPQNRGPFGKIIIYIRRNFYLFTVTTRLKTGSEENPTDYCYWVLFTSFIILILFGILSILNLLAIKRSMKVSIFFLFVMGTLWLAIESVGGDLHKLIEENSKFKEYFEAEVVAVASKSRFLYVRQMGHNWSRFAAGATKYRRHAVSGARYIGKGFMVAAGGGTVGYVGVSVYDTHKNAETAKFIVQKQIDNDNEQKRISNEIESEHRNADRAAEDERRRFDREAEDERSNRAITAEDERSRLDREADLQKHKDMLKTDLEKHNSMLKDKELDRQHERDRWAHEEKMNSQKPLTPNAEKPSSDPSEIRKNKIKEVLAAIEEAKKSKDSGKRQFSTSSTGEIAEEALNFDEEAQALLLAEAKAHIAKALLVELIEQNYVTVNAFENLQQFITKLNQAAQDQEKIVANNLNEDSDDGIEHKVESTDENEDEAEKNNFEAMGVVTSVKDGVVQAKGLTSIASGQLVEFFPSKIKGIALNLLETTVSIVVFGDDEKIKVDDIVILSTLVNTVVGGFNRLGTICNALGEVINEDSKFLYNNPNNK